MCIKNAEEMRKLCRKGKVELYPDRGKLKRWLLSGRYIRMQKLDSGFLVVVVVSAFLVMCVTAVLLVCEGKGISEGELLEMALLPGRRRERRSCGKETHREPHVLTKLLELHRHSRSLSFGGNVSQILINLFIGRA